MKALSSLNYGFNRWNYKSFCSEIKCSLNIHIIARLFMFCLLIYFFFYSTCC